MPSFWYIGTGVWGRLVSQAKWNIIDLVLAKKKIDCQLVYQPKQTHKSWRNVDKITCGWECLSLFLNQCCYFSLSFSSENGDSLLLPFTVDRKFCWHRFAENRVNVEKKQQQSLLFPPSDVSCDQFYFSFGEDNCQYAQKLSIKFFWTIPKQLYFISAVIQAWSGGSDPPRIRDL